MISLNDVRLTDEEFKLITTLVHEKFGICLGEQKRSLVIGRLQQVLLSGRFKSFKEYYDYVVAESTGRGLLTLVDRISTNHTYFFREKDHFDFFLGEALPRCAETAAKEERRNLRIWCAGCSSGEEPYTLAMLIAEDLGGRFAGEVNILATDIAVSALEEARVGIYPEERLTGMPPGYRLKYFTRLKDGRWAIKPGLKNMVLFRRLNLVRREYPFKGGFHAIFCRNVMIYFDSPTQHAVIERFHRHTEPGGYLFVGHSESVDRSLGFYRYLKPSIYQKI